MKFTVPSNTATKFEPFGAGISIPLWNELALAVGELRFPKYELILVYPGTGQQKSEFDISKFWEILVWVISKLELSEIIGTNRVGIIRIIDKNGIIILDKLLKDIKPPRIN